MYVRVSDYGSHYSHRTPLAGDEALVPLPAPPPGAVFATLTGVTFAVPVGAMLLHKFFSGSHGWKRSFEVGLMAAGVAYLLGGLATAGAATAAASIMQEGSEP